MTDLARKLKDQSAVVAVAGLGTVGLPMAAAMVHGGFHVLGYDVDTEIVRGLNGGKVHRRYLEEDFAQKLVDSGRFGATDDPARLVEADAILLCVPTPLDDNQEPDLSHVCEVTQRVAQILRPGQLVVLESTTWPGSTREVVLPILEKEGRKKGLSCGRDFFLAYAPEREDPGRKDITTAGIPRLVGGVDDASQEMAVCLYECVVDGVIPVSSAEVAEASKLLENCYRAVNIAMVNELKVVFQAMGLDVREILDGAATKPFGFQRFDPGPGLGGHCIPVDPFYLAWKAQQVGVSADLVGLAGKINRAMPDYVIQRTIDALREEGIDPEGAEVLVLGVGYKPEIDDVRESPSIALMEGLAKEGVRVRYHDPYVPTVSLMLRGEPVVLESHPLDQVVVSKADAALIATAHRSVDYDMLRCHARLIVDTRGVMKKEGPVRVVDA